MVCCQLSITNSSELNAYVNETLCHHNHLKKDAFQMTKRVLTRSGRPCGIFYCLHGPRMVKFTAIWEMEKNQVLFYGPTGEKFQQTKLLDSIADADAVL
ncbi:MAG: hypothetical protein Q4D98_13185 [Planctomycetia bacterium]|nr:hypothetical protein [Planctomycetia bacterium]